MAKKMKFLRVLKGVHASFAKLCAIPSVKGLWP